MGKPFGESQQRLQFVCDMLRQLRGMVPEQAGPLLPYLIDMARMEADEILLYPGPSTTDTRPPG